MKPSSGTAATQHEWEDLAELDPLWAILTEKERQFGSWDVNEFFDSGRREVDSVLQDCGFTPGAEGKALDFGCGVGRLSRALRSYFAEVYGVDISERMIKLAREYTPSCHFVLNQSENLSLFQDNFFDFIYSNIVLQHQSTKDIAGAYIKEFVRVIKPKGMIVFQMPHKLTWRQTLQPRRRLYSLLRALGLSSQYLYNELHLNPMRTICLSSKAVEETISKAGGHLLRTYSNSFNVHSTTYVATKN